MDLNFDFKIPVIKEFTDQNTSNIFKFFKKKMCQLSKFKYNQIEFTIIFIKAVWGYWWLNVLKCHLMDHIASNHLISATGSLLHKKILSVYL